MRSFFLLIFLCFSSFGAAQTWTGTVSSAWNDPDNWSTFAVPGAGNNVTIDGTGTFQPELSSNVVIRDLNFSGGTINLNGFTLEIRNGSFTGGVIENGAIEAVNYNALQDMVFNGDISLTKIAGGDNNLNGGNVFNGPTTITNFDNRRLRFAVDNGDTFNSTIVINKNGTGAIEMAYNGTNIFADQITVNNLTINNRISFGDGGGTSELQTGGLVTSSFGIGTLIINNFTQLTASPNSSFNPSVFTINNSTLLGEISVETTGTISILGSNTFGSDVTFISGDQLNMPDGGNSFNTTGGSTSFTKNGGGNVNWGGGNTFGTVEFVNNTNSRIRMAVNGIGDTFLSTSVFNNNGTSSIGIARTGNNTFADQITINNNSGGRFNLGIAGVITQSSGGLVTTNFSSGNLDIRNFTQVENVPNGDFFPENFRVENSTFRGNLNVTTGGIIEFIGGNSFEGNNNFVSGGNITMAIGGNTFSLPGNTTNITRNGGGSVTWGPGNSTGNFNLVDNADGNLTMQGGNTFHGHVSFTKNENRVLRLANLDGDTFLQTSEFINNGTSVIDIAYRGTNSFADEITIDNNAGGQIRFGQDGGTTNLTDGGLVTNNFNSGNLDIREFTQTENFPNGPFFPDSFRADDNDFEGDFSVTTSGNLDLRENNRFASNNSFIANGQIILRGNSQFSTNAGTNSYFEKNGAGDVNWNGGNTFGTVEFVNNTDRRILFTNGGIGDTFISTSTFRNNTTGNFEIARNGNNSFADNISINNPLGGNFSFGLGGGVSTLATGAITTSDFTGGSLDIRNFTQVEDAPNGPFSPDSFRADDNDFEGDFSVTTSGNLDLRENNRFASNNSFIANGQLILRGNSQFSTNAGTNSYFEKNGGGNVDWNGGNTFGTVEFVNNTNSRIRMANNGIGDTFSAISTFNNNGTNNFEIARTGTNNFASTITVNNSSTGTISFGVNGGTSLLSAGGIQTTGFNSGTLDIRNFSQVTATANGNFQPENFLSDNVSFLGNFTVSTSNTGANSILIRNGSRFAGNNTFTSAGGINLTGGDNRFSLIPGNQTTMTKNGNVNNDWAGTNQFGIFTLNNNGNGRIRMAHSLGGDTFTGTSNFNNNGTSNIEIARTGTNNFASTITVNNSSTGTISFGVNGGTSLLSAGGIQTTGFNSGTLDIRNFSQVTATANGNFQPENFLSDNVSFLGNFTVSTSNTGANSILIRNGSRFAGNNTFTSAGGINLTGGDNRFSLIPGNQTTMTKNGNANNDWAGTNRFGNFTLINNGGGRIRMANNTGGDQFIGNVTFNQNGSGVIEPARNFNNTFQGNISTVGSGNSIRFGAGNGVVEIIGDAAQELTGDAANEPRIDRLTMNTTGTLEVLVPLTIGNNMTLTNGIINNEENLVTFIHNSGVTGGSNESHVNGRIRKVGSSEFTFPFGNNGFYAPLTRSSGGNSSQHFTGRYFNTDPSGSGFDRDSKVSSIGEVDACEYWEFERTNGTTTPNITLSWSDDRTCPIIDHEEFIVVQWDGAEWQDLEGTDLTGDETAGTVRNNNAVDYSHQILTLGQSFRILPIELLSFDAFAINEREIKVTWATVQEKDNAFFTINKSLDGQTWFPIGVIPGAGNSDEILFYDFIDENPVFGRQFYRLTQTDFDGTSETFNVVGVTLQNAGENIDYKVYPNPSNGEFNIMSLNHNMEEAEISIVNTAGIEVRNFKDISGRFFSNDLSGLPKGMYVVRIKEDHVWRVKKLIIH